MKETENNQKNYYAVIPATVRYHKDIPALGKLLYGEITALTNEKGYCWATNEYFAELYGCHTRTISRLISKLKELKFIDVDIQERYKRKIYLMDGQNCLRGTTKMSNPHDKNSVGDRQNCEDIKVNNKENIKKNIKHNSNGKFVKPSINEISDYCKERDNTIDPNQFFDFYECKGWMVGKNKMKDWKAAIRTWEKNEYHKKDNLDAFGNPRKPHIEYDKYGIPEHSEAG